MRFRAMRHRAAHVGAQGKRELAQNKSQTLIVFSGQYRWSAVVRGAVDTGYRRNHTAVPLRLRQP